MLLTIFLIGSMTSLNAQDLLREVEIKVVSVEHDFQCCNDAAGTCNFLPDRPEPRWNFTTTYGTTTLPTYFLNLGDGVECGVYPQNITLLSSSLTCVESISIEIESWEDDVNPDITGTDCTALDANCDDIWEIFTTIINLNGQNEGVVTNYEVIQNNGYKTIFSVEWNSITPDVDPVPTVCNGDEAMLSIATLDPAIDTYLWFDGCYVSSTSIGSGTTPIVTGETVSIDPLTLNNSMSEVYVVGADANGCYSEGVCLTIPVVSTFPAPTVDNDNFLVCEGGSVTVNVTSGLASPTNQFHWYNDDNIDGNEDGVGTSYTLNSIVSDTIIYVLESGGSCDGMVTPITISISSITPPPIASDLQTCPFGQVTLTASTGGANGTFNWYDVADLSNSVSVLTPPLPDNPAGYNYWVTEVDPITGCESLPTMITVTTDLVINAPSASDASVCEGESASLTASSNSSTSGSFFWYNDTGANDLAYAGNPFNTLAINTNTTYYVVEDINGCRSTPVEVNVTTDPKPAAPTGMDETICSGMSATVSVTNAGGNTQWYSDASGVNPINGATSPTYTSPALYSNTTYFAGETNALGCMSDLTPITVTVLPLPSSPSTSALNLCESEEGTLTASIGAFDGVITWYNDLGEELEVDNVLPATAEFLVSSDTLPIGSTIYYVSYTNTDGCESTWVTVSVNVTASPATPVNIADVSVCAGNFATFTGGPGVYNWYLNMSDTNPYSTGQSFTSPSEINTQTSFYVTEVVNGCESEKEEVVANVAMSLTPPNISSNSPICEGEDLVLSVDDPINPNYIYTWTDPNGITTNPTFTTTSGSLNSGAYILTIEDMNTNCTASSSILVDVTTAPQSSPLFSNSPVCSGGDIVLTTNSISGATYFWSGPGIAGNPSTTVPTFTITNANPINSGTYSVSIENGGCDPADVSTEVMVSDIPPAPTTTNIQACKGENIILSATGSGGTLNYYFANTPISPIVGANLAVGTYTYLTTETINGCESASAPIEVTILAQPSVPIVSDIAACEGETVTLSSLSSGTIIWYDDEALTNDVPETQTLNAGTHVFYATQTVGACTSEPSALVVTINTGAFATPTTSDIEVCEGDGVILSATGSGTGSLTYYDTNNTIISPNLGVLPPGSYSYTVTEGNGACESLNPATITVLVNDNPEFLSDIAAVNPLCEGETLNIAAPDVNVTNVTYEWTYPNTNTDASEDITINNVTEGDQGVYNVVATNTNTGCESDAEFVYVQVNSIPSGIIATNSGATCVGGTVNLTATGIFGATYSWAAPSGSQLENDPAAETQNPVLTNVTTADEGLYLLEVTVGNCVSTVLETYVSVSNGPSISAGQDIEILQGETAILQGAGGINYTWSSTDIGYLNSTGVANPMFGGAPVGTYTYTVTGYDANFCSGTDEVIVTVLANDNLEIVDLFTPNGDGVNDTWKITYLENLKDYTLKIYARSGVQVFETDNYNNDWDGTYEGENLPDGTYWYVIKSTDGATYKGAVTMKR